LKRNTYATCTHNNTIYFSFASLSLTPLTISSSMAHTQVHTHTICLSALLLFGAKSLWFLHLCLCSFLSFFAHLCYALIHSLAHAHAHSFVPWRLLFLLPLMLTTAFHDSVHPSRATLIYYSCFAFLVLFFLCESNRIKMSEGQYMQENENERERLRKTSVVQ